MKTSTVFFALWLGRCVSETPLDTLCAQADKVQNCRSTGLMTRTAFEALCLAAPECKAYVEAGLGQSTSNFYMLGEVGATANGQGNHDCYTRTAQDTFTKESGFCYAAGSTDTKASNYICQDKGPCTPTTTTEKPCASEETACMQDATCRGIVEQDQPDTKNCAANGLCTKFYACITPCFGKLAACEANQACADVFPDPEGESDPTAAEILKCVSNPLCKEVAICFNVPIPTDPCASEKTACMQDATCRDIIDVQSYWTEWFNFDAPSGNADNEALELQRVIPHPCLEKTPLEASCVRVSDGMKSTETGQVFNIPCGVTGLLCLNADNTAGCADYQVKYRCPSAATPGSNTRTEDCAASQLCSKFMNCFTGPEKTCKSVGDPHVTPFEMAHFDNHHTGWKTLYFKGNLKIQANQKQWLLTNAGSNPVAVNAGVRYTTKADMTLTAASWLPPNGQTLENLVGARSAGAFVVPTSPITMSSTTLPTDIKFPTGYLTSLTLKVDYQNFGDDARDLEPTARLIYNIWITTNNYVGAKGQCAEGQPGEDNRQRRSLEDSGGVPFPTLPPLATNAQKAYFVTEAEAKAACKAIINLQLQTDCVTDVRMMNDPAYNAHIVHGFMKVEAIDRELEGKSGVEGWALGAAGKSCTVACQDIGTTCNDAHLQSLKGNPDGVRLAFADAGHPCKFIGHSCVTDGNKCVSYGAPFIHASNMREGACQSPGPGDESVATCAQVPIDQNHRRLCACGTPPEKPTPVKKVCSSVGDPHVRPFFGAMFDTHITGWKVLYKKGNFEVQLLQDMWDRTSSRHVAINRAVKYTEDGTNWEKVGCELAEAFDCANAGQLFSSSLGWIGFGTAATATVQKTFTNPNVHLLVAWYDYTSTSWTNTKKIYDVFVTTDQIEGSTGQCAEGRLRRRLSDGVEFPQGGINQADADSKCASLGDMKRNCAYDVRMANDEAATPLLVDHFNEVERTLKSIQVRVISGKAPDDCSQQGFDFGAWCDFAAECGAAYAAAGLYMGTETQRDGFPCPDGSKAVQNDFAGVHTKKCCSCEGTFCAVTTTTTTPATTKTKPSGPIPDCTPVSASEQAWQMWDSSTPNGRGVCTRKGCSCEDMQRVWKVCTHPTDPNHAAVVNNCPVSCAKAQGKCQVPKPLPPTGPMKTCRSVGDPHIYPFPGGGLPIKFDNHAVGWKTLYLKGDLMIQAHQKTWLNTGTDVAINAAVRYTMKATTGDLNAASTWQTPNGQTVKNPSMAPFATSAALFAEPATSTNARLTSPKVIEFPDNFLTLRITSQLSARWRALPTIIPGLAFFYGVWITTNDQLGAEGQCVNGKADQDAGMRRRMQSNNSAVVEDSAGVFFPHGLDVQVTKEQAEAACAAISNNDLKTDCVTDARMLNEPGFVDDIVGGFKNVEVVDKEIVEWLASTTATVTASPTTVTVDSATTAVDSATTAVDSATTAVTTPTVDSAIRTSVTFLIVIVLAVGFCV